jgi:leucyl-tRNA synthetase
MADKYTHREIEASTQKKWEELDIYRTDLTDTSKDPYYLLFEFPYPSGDLHIGHWYAFAVTDIYARFKRIMGKNVLFPIGFDSFGLPAENAAIKNGANPEEWTNKNIDRMRAQIRSIGSSVDWSKEIITSSPEYYKWTQWLFVKLFEHDLAYKSKALVNWDPVDMTVLANEQVLPDGTAERSGALVEKKELEQWFFRITAYADRLLADLDPLPWRNEIKEAQRAWIGKSEGSHITFAIEGSEEKIKVFTTRPDTIFGATYVVLAPEHSLVETLLPSIKNAEEVKAYRTATSRKSERDRSENKEKTGVCLEGISAINPATKESIPVYIADYVLANYGTGAVMAVPAHDERDFEFVRAINARNTRHFIFDFDGVVGNTFETATKALISMGDYADEETAHEHIIKYASKKPIHSRDHTLSDEELKEEYSWTKRFGTEMLKHEFDLFEDFIDEIEKISDVKIAIVSSGSRLYVDPAIEASRLNPSHILAFEDHHSKEEKIERIAKDWGISVKQVSYFTDTKADFLELKDLLDPTKIFGCAWGYLGKEGLLEVMSENQILTEPKDIHCVIGPVSTTKPLEIKHVVIPRMIDAGNPPVEGKPVVARNTILGIVYDPKTSKYLALKWKEQPWTTFITGGVDEGEDVVEAAKREIYEETGYKNIALTRVLGGPIQSEFFAAHKDENRIAYGTSILFELVDDTRDEITEEESKKHEAVWLPLNEILAEKMRHAEIEVIVSRMSKPDEAYTGDGVLYNCGEFSGRENMEALWDVAAHVEGERTTNYRIRDWLVSRQRYWGCPIPIAYDPEGKPHAIPSEHLPWLLPTDVDFKPTGKAPLASSKELQDRVTRIFGEGWTPEYDTLDVFVDSSWYYMRYLDPKDDHDFTDQSLMKKWMPVDRYSGGSEHTTVHLLYARFFNKALHDLALSPVSEPFNERFNRGLIMGTDGQKMSKRWGNVVNPDEMVEKFGADAVRVYLAFIGPYNEPGSYPWNLDGVHSMRKFLDRVMRVSEKVSDDTPTDELTRALAKAAHKVADDSERFKFNTAVAALMIVLKDFEALEKAPKGAWQDFLRLLAPFAPHIAEHLWEKTQGEGSIHSSIWPVYDEALLTTETVEVTVQVNGKRRGTITLSADASEGDALSAAKAIPSVETALEGREPSRIVYVPGRILNLVVV